MKIKKFLLAFCFVFILGCAAFGQPAKQKCEILEVETISAAIRRGQKPQFTFNENRPYVISINQGIPNSVALRGELVELIGCREVSNIVFEWFGSKKIDSIELMIGNKIPVKVAQAVIRVFTKSGDIPVIVSLSEEDEMFGYTQRIVIGSLIKSNKNPLDKKTIEALLKEGITQEEFMKLLM